MKRSMVFLFMLISFTSFAQGIEGSLLNNNSVDSIKDNANSSFWNKLSYSIGYSGERKGLEGLMYSSGYDRKSKVYAYTSDWDLIWTKDVQGNIGANPCVSDLDNDGKRKYMLGNTGNTKFSIGVSTGILRAIRQYDNPIGDWSPYLGGRISLFSPKISGTLFYYPQMLLGPQPISIQRRLRILEGSILIRKKLFDWNHYRNMDSFIEAGLAISYAKYTSIYLGKGGQIIYPLSIGPCMYVGFSIPLNSYYSLNIDIGAKYYTLKNSKSFFKIEGVPLGIEIVYSKRR